MPCSQDPNRIGYSKVVIKQILTPSQWRAQPQITKNFSQPFDPQFYNYYDYIKAQDRSLLLQNNIYKHIWFFCFDIYRKKDIMIPRWFINWWNSYGPEAMILSLDLLKAYETFKKELDIPHLKNFPHLLQFFYRFPNLSWIIRWEYKIERHPQYPFLILTRKFKLKWWSKFNFDQICQELQKKTSSSKQKVLISFQKKVKSSVSLLPSQTKNNLRNSSLKLYHKFRMMKMTQ